MLRFPRWDLTFRHRPPSLNGASSISPALHLPLSTTPAPKRTSHVPWIHLPPPPPPDVLAQGRNAVGAPWVTGTSRRCLPSGCPELEVLCASGRRCGAQRTASPRGPPPLLPFGVRHQEVPWLCRHHRWWQCRLPTPRGASIGRSRRQRPSWDPFLLPLKIRCHRRWHLS
jgi:hypothetical protein